MCINNMVNLANIVLIIIEGLAMLTYCNRTKAELASYPGPFEKSEKRAWYPLFAHALN